MTGKLFELTKICKIIKKKKRQLGKIHCIGHHHLPLYWWLTCWRLFLFFTFDLQRFLIEFNWFKKITILHQAYFFSLPVHCSQILPPPLTVVLSHVIDLVLTFRETGDCDHGVGSLGELGGASILNNHTSKRDTTLLPKTLRQWILILIMCSTFTLLSDVGHITHTCTQQHMDRQTWQLRDTGKTTPMMVELWQFRNFDHHIFCKLK